MLQDSKELVNDIIDIFEGPVDDLPVMEVEEEAIEETCEIGEETGNDHSTYDPEPTAHERPIAEETLALIRSKWQFSAICQFFLLFQDQVGVELFDTNDLEVALAFPSTDDWLCEVQVRMFRVGTKNRFIMPDTWLLYVQREFEKQQLYPPSWQVAEMKYEDIPLETRIIILHMICELQFDRHDTLKIVTETPETLAANWRVEPIGHDSKGYTYYLFDDSRLYSESKSKKEPIWKCCCITKNDWLSFSETFKDSNSTLDRKLYKYLINDLMPLVFRDLELMEHQRKEKREKLRQIELAIAEEERRLKEEQRLEEERKALEAMAAAEAEQDRRRTRRQLRGYSRGPRTEEEMKVEKLQARELRRLQRESKVLGEYQLERSNSAQSFRTTNSVSKETKDESEYVEKRKPKPKPKRKSTRKVPSRKKRRADSDSEEFPSDDDTEEEEISMESDTELPSPMVDEKEWWFSCVCGKEGQNFDDASPTICCEVCSTWQHIVCVATIEEGEDEEDVDIAEWSKKEFICKTCRPKKRKEAVKRDAPRNDTRLNDSYVDGSLNETNQESLMEAEKVAVKREDVVSVSDAKPIDNET